MSQAEKRKAALRRYIVFRVKAIEFLDLAALHNSLGHPSQARACVALPSFPPFRPGKFVSDSVRTVIVSWFALFIDKNGMDVRKVWSDVFPHHATMVNEAWTRMEPAWPILRQFRNRAGFHADTPMRFFGARRELRAQYDAVVQPALAEFEKVFKFFLSAEGRERQPELEGAVDSLLDDLETIQGGKFQRAQLKAYLMIPGESPGSSASR
jgi:hypothetical protein